MSTAGLAIFNGTGGDTLTADEATQPQLFDANRVQRFRRALRKWYAQHGRELPWRSSREAYCIWISEIMLQQTTVAAVTPYFERFLTRFPTVTELAAADEHDVLKLWEGLGYYSRARNLHKASRVIVEEFDGEFPEDVTTLQQLPGVGRYTAGAIASIAYDVAAPIVEANTLRLYCRLLGYAEDPKKSAGQKTLWAFAEQLVPARNAGDFNAALMDLGATVCRPTQPDCAACPVSRCCRAFAAGTQDTIPLAGKRKVLTDITDVSVAIRHRGQYLLRQRTTTERWAGLWDFPRYTLTDAEAVDIVVPGGKRKNTAGNRASLFESKVLPATAATRLQKEITDQTGVETVLSGLQHVIHHGVTRYRIRLLCFAADRVGGRLKRDAGLVWVPPQKLGEYALSTTGRKFAEFLVENRSRQSPV